MIPSSSGSSRNESATADRLEIFLVCSVHKVSKWIAAGRNGVCAMVMLLECPLSNLIKMLAMSCASRSLACCCRPSSSPKSAGLNQVSGSGIFPGAKLSVDRKPIIARDLLASQITCANGKRKRMVLFLPRRGAGTAPTSIWLSIAWPLLCMSLIFLAVSLCLSISFKDREPSSCVSLVWRKRYERCLEPFSCHQSCRAKS